jgi:hypothetical protein
MSGWFLVLWIAGAGDLTGWPEAHSGKIVGPMVSQELCVDMQKQIMEWRAPVFAHCVHIQPIGG